MREHHTKGKGDYAVLKVKLDLYEQGYNCYTCDTEHSEFDLIAYSSGGNFYRVQVKYRTATSGKIAVMFKSTWSDKNGVHSLPVDKTEIDLYAVYCPDTDLCYYFNPSDYKTGITLRIDPPKNNQKAGVNMAENYTRVP